MLSRAAPPRSPQHGGGGRSQLPAPVPGLWWGWGTGQPGGDSPTDPALCPPGRSLSLPASLVLFSQILGFAPNGVWRCSGHPRDPLHPKTLWPAPPGSALRSPQKDTGFPSQSPSSLWGPPRCPPHTHTPRLSASSAPGLGASAPRTPPLPQYGAGHGGTPLPERVRAPQLGPCPMQQPAELMHPKKWALGIPKIEGRTCAPQYMGTRNPRRGSRARAPQNTVNRESPGKGAELMHPKTQALGLSRRGGTACAPQNMGTGALRKRGQSSCTPKHRHWGSPG